MIKIRIYCGNDFVDIVLPKEELWKLKNFANRQEDMQIYEI